MKNPFGFNESLGLLFPGAAKEYTCRACGKAFFADVNPQICRHCGFDGNGLETAAEVGEYLLSLGCRRDMRTRRGRNAWKMRVRAGLDQFAKLLKLQKSLGI